jgi:hypothetical protein
LWIDVNDLLQGTTPLRKEGLLLQRLDDTNALIHACIHAVLGRQQPRLMPLRDVLQIAWIGDIDWDLLGRRADAWRVLAPVSHGLLVAATILDSPLPDAAVVVRSASVRRIERRVLLAYTTDRSRRGGPALAALWAIPGIRPRLAYLRALLFPNKGFRAARGAAGSLVRRWKVPFGWITGRLLPRTPAKEQRRRLPPRPRR